MSKEFSIKDPLELINEVEQYQAELAGKWEELEQQRQKSEAERQPERLSAWLGSDDPTKINPDTAKSMKEYLASRPTTKHAEEILFMRWHKEHNLLASSAQRVSEVGTEETEVEEAKPSRNVAEEVHEQPKDEKDEAEVRDDEVVSDEQAEPPVEREVADKAPEDKPLGEVPTWEDGKGDGEYKAPEWSERPAKSPKVNGDNDTVLHTSEHPYFRSLQKLQYIMSDGRYHKVGEMAAEGDKMNWDSEPETRDDNPNRRIILSTPSAELYVKGDKMYVVNQLENGELEIANTTSASKLANTAIGNSMKVDFGKQGRLETTIRKVEVSLGESNAPTAGYKLQDEADPFEELDRLAAEETSKTGRGRMKRTWGKVRGAFLLAGAKLQNGVHNTREYYGDDEKGKRRKSVSLAVGAIALGGAVYIAYKQGIFGGNMKVNARPDNINQVNLPPPKLGGDSTREALNYKAAHGADIVGSNVGSHISEQLSARSLHIELYPGGNIWDSVAENLQARGYQANTYNIDAVKDIILQKYHLTEEQARHLAVGFSFDMLNDEELKELGIAKV